MSKLFLFLLLLPINLYAQLNSQSVEIQSIITTNNPKDYINIPNTHIYLIPPKDFIVSNSFSGLKRNDSTIIVCYEIYDKDQISKQPPLEEPIHDQEGAKVMQFKKISINKVNGAYILFQKNKRFNIYELVFGNDDFRIMITATGLSNDEILKNEILSTFNTVYYEKK